MNETQLSQLRRFYQLQQETLRLERTTEKQRQRWDDARGEKIICQENLMNYEAFSLKSILDRLKGRYTDQLEQYRRAFRQAEAEQKAAQRELEMLQQRQKQNREELDLLPPQEAIRSWIGEDCAGREEFFRLETKLCLAALPPLLEENRKALVDAHAFLRGEYAGQIMSYQQQQEIFAGPDPWGEACGSWLQRLKTALDGLQIPFEIPAYYQNSKTYIVSSATRFSRIDRAAQALAQATAMQKKIEKIKQVIQ